MSLRRFHGWEPRQWHTTDTQGRTIVVTEPEYDATEQALQAAYDAYQAGICDGCGQPLTECLVDATSDTAPPEYQAAYQECRACDVIENAVNQLAASDREKTEANQFPASTRHRRWTVNRLNQTN